VIAFIVIGCIGIAIFAVLIVAALLISKIEETDDEDY